MVNKNILKIRKELDKLDNIIRNNKKTLKTCRLSY